MTTVADLIKYLSQLQGDTIVVTDSIGDDSERSIDLSACLHYEQAYWNPETKEFHDESSYQEFLADPDSHYKDLASKLVKKSVVSIKSHHISWCDSDMGTLKNFATK